MDKSPVIWFTGMSASGKSTLANYLKDSLFKRGYKGTIIDGDTIRDRDKQKLSYGFNDVLTNNIRIASLCEEQRTTYDFVLVPVISPYEEVRKKVRKILEPNFHLVYLKSDISSLKCRDPKGLYAAADRGEINDLIGYSAINPYDEPVDPELVVSTSSDILVDDSFDVIFEYVNHFVFIDNYLF